MPDNHPDACISLDPALRVTEGIFKILEQTCTATQAACRRLSQDLMGRTILVTWPPGSHMELSATDCLCSVIQD